MWLQPTKPLGNFFSFWAIMNHYPRWFPCLLLAIFEQFSVYQRLNQVLNPCCPQRSALFLWSCLWHVEYYSWVWQRYRWKGDGFRVLSLLNKVMVWKPLLHTSIQIFWVSPLFPESQTVGTNKQSGISICLIAAGTQLKRWIVNWPIYKEKQRLFNRRT